MSRKEFDVIIIGGGVAGISAALWCDELELDAILLESGSELGGQLLWTFNAIENHLGVKAENGKQMRDIFLAQIKQRKFTLSLDSRVEKVDLEKKLVAINNGEKFQAKSVVIATGVSRRKLNVKGEKKFQGKGIISSGKRDGKLVTGKTVAVIGGGDAAFENALILSEFASKVLLINRSVDFKARSEFVSEVRENPKIEILVNTIVSEIIGAGNVESIKLKNRETNQIFNQSIDFIITRIGVEPNTKEFQEQIETDEKGYIKVNSSGQTNLENIYAIGDVANPLSPTISSAAGMGSTAVKAILSKQK